MSGYTRRDVLKAAGSVGILAASSSPFSVFAASGALANIDPTIHENKTLNMKPIPAGTVIDANNYKNFPELEQFLPSNLAKRLKRGATRYDLPLPIKIMPTRKLRYDEPDRVWAEKNKGVVKLSDDNSKLVNWDAGIPFPEPKNIHEVSVNFYKRRFNGDSYKVYINFIVLDKADRRKDVAFTYWQKPWSGRTSLPPVPRYSDTDIDWKGTTLFTKPHDAKGFSILRFRYNDYNKTDDTWAYMPAIRRVRRFTGADVQDPLFGTDVTMDDYANFEQKIDYKNIYPEKIELGQNLIYSYPDAHVDGNYVSKFDGKFMHVPGWEFRKYYKVTYRVTDKNYMYGSRVMWIDAETWLPVYSEFYDQKNNLYRSWNNLIWWTDDGKRNWANVEIVDWINGSKTFLLFKSEPYNFIYPDSVFTLEFLKSQGR